jgi:hypothetical protein
VADVVITVKTGSCGGGMPIVACSAEDELQLYPNRIIAPEQIITKGTLKKIFKKFFIIINLIFTNYYLLVARFTATGARRSQACFLFQPLCEMTIKPKGKGHFQKILTFHDLKSILQEKTVSLLKSVQ